MKLITTLRRVAGRADERGMSTSEYAVGTLGACTIGGVLVKIGHKNSPMPSDRFSGLVERRRSCGLSWVSLRPRVGSI